MNESPVLSIIIVSYNTRQITCQCLQSIYKAVWDFPFEVILVDNNSHDDTLDYIRRDFPDVKIIANDDNKLFAVANNQGAEISKGKFLLLLNSDTIVESDNLCRLVHYMENLPQKVVCVGPKILNKDRSIQSEGMVLGVPGTLCKHFQLHKLLPDGLIRIVLPAGLPLRHAVARKVGWVSGACMLIRSDYYHATGGLNEKLIFYGEEPEFSWRAQKNGKDTWYYPDCQIIHLGGASTSPKKDKTHGYKTYLAFVKLTTGVPAALVQEAGQALADFSKLLITCNPVYWEQFKNRFEVASFLLKNRKNVSK